MSSKKKAANNRDTEAYSKAKQYCLRLLKSRQRSEYEFNNYLRQKGFDKELAKEVILCFIENGLVNDTAFAKAWIESRMKHPVGEARLKLELVRKGIGKKIIEESINQA